jgi:hypothetical protein
LTFRHLIAFNRSATRKLLNVARRNVDGRLDALGHYFIVDQATGANIDASDVQVVGRLSTTNGALLT